MDASLNILLVEDSPTDVLLAQEALGDHPQFYVTVADRLAKALQLLTDRSFDIVLLDLGLPDSQGLDTLVRLRQCNPAIPVIVMTARDDEKLAFQAVQEGSQDYLVKGQVQEGMLARAIRYAIERNAVRQILREREELFRGAFEHTAVGMVMTDLDNRFLRLNEAFARMFGFDVGEMIGMNLAEVIHPDDIAESLLRRDRLLTGEDYFFQQQKRYIHRDGHIFWGLTNVSLVRDADRKPLYYIGQVQDVTQQKMAEGERDQLFRESIALLGIAGFDGYFHRINPAWERTLGYTFDELLANPFMNLVHPDDKQVTLAQIKRLAGGEIIKSFENRLRCKDGTYRSFLWSGTPLLDQQAFSVTGHDTTDQKRADEAVRLRDRAMQSVSQGILITDPNQPDNPIIYASAGAERLTGYRSEEMVGRNCRFLQGPKTDPDAVGIVRAAIRNGTDCSVELLNFRKDGTAFWNALFVTPVRDEQGKLVHFIGVQADVTERRKLEDQVRVAQKMEAFGQLAGGIAHDFNNLLTIISGYSEILLMSLPSSDSNWASLKAITEASERAADLTRQLLSFSRQTVLEPQVRDLNEVVKEAEKMLRRLIGEDVLFTTVLDPNISLVKIDPGQIGQVLMNLAVNARDAMPQGGKLTIETSNVKLDEPYVNTHIEVQAGRYVLLTVSDTGSGMTPEVKARVFEPFYTTKGVGKGTGLGLSVVHGIIKQSNGHIGVYSEPGIGTTFKIYLPTVDSVIVAPADSDKSLKVEPGNETILLVEDEDGVREMALIALRTQGYKVLSAANGKQAMQVVSEHKGGIDILVTDVVMPEMSGRQLAELLQPQLPQMKVLYMSGYTDDAIVRHGILQAKVSFLQKPYTPMSLLRKVRQVLEQK